MLALLVIDINLKNHPVIKWMGIEVAYGDISNPETLRHHGIDQAEVVLSTVADTYLRGTSNLRLLQMVLSPNPRVRFIGTASNAEETQALLLKGAFGAVCAAESAAPEYDELLLRSLA